MEKEWPGGVKQVRLGGIYPYEGRSGEENVPSFVVHHPHTHSYIRLLQSGMNHLNARHASVSCIRNQQFRYIYMVRQSALL